MQPILQPLTALRFFAAAAVVMCHRLRTDPNEWLPYERFGGAGVSFFFLLSGFILAYTYHARLLARRPGAVRDFLTARAARVLPAYVLAFALALWTCAEGRSLLSGKFGSALWPAVAQLTLAQSFVPKMSYYFGFNSPAWSLSCEWFFYLAFPPLLIGLATGPLWRRAAVFALASATWATVLAAYLLSPGDPAGRYFTWAWLGYVFPLTRVFDFVCGVALGVLFVRRKPAVGPAPGRAYWAWGLVEVGALAALWAVLHFCPVSPGVNGAQTFAVQMLGWQGYFLPTFAALVWVGALGRGPVSRALSWSPLVYLGELSYGIYIFHIPVLRLVVTLFPQIGWEFAAWGRAVMTGGAVAVLAVSALSFHFLETPIRRWVRGRPKPAPLVAEAPRPVRRAA